MNIKKVKKTISQTSQQTHSAATQFDAIYDRIKLCLGAKTDTELARVLGIDQSSIAGARKRNNIPPKWIIDVSERFGISADWLLFGDGAMLRDRQGVLPLRIHQRDKMIDSITRFTSSFSLILGFAGENRILPSKKDEVKLLDLIEKNVLKELTLAFSDLLSNILQIIPNYVVDVEKTQKK